MFTFGLQTFVCTQFLVFSRMSWLKYLFYTDIFLNTYLCMKFSMYTQSLLRRAIRSYFVTSWLNLYQSSEASTLWILWSLVKPVILFFIWQPPAFPYRHQYSIIGRFRLNHRVRDVDGCFPKAHRHQKFSVIFLITQQWITFTRFP